MMIVDCAVYEAGPPPRRRAVGCARPTSVSRRSTRSSGSACTSRPRRSSTRSRAEFNLHELAVEDAINAHQRPKLEVYGDTVFIVLKTARYIDPDGDRRVRRDPDLRRRGLPDHRPPRRGERRCTRCASALEAQPELLRARPRRRAARDRGPGRRRLRAGDRRASRTTSRRSRRTSSRPTARNPAERIYKLKREVLEFHRATGAAGGAARAAGRAAATQLIHAEVRAYFRDVNDHLLRVRRAASRASASCSPACSRRTWPRSPCARTRTCARSRPGSRSSRCRR